MIRKLSFILLLALIFSFVGCQIVEEDGPNPYSIYGTWYGIQYDGAECLLVLNTDNTYTYTVDSPDYEEYIAAGIFRYDDAYYSGDFSDYIHFFPEVGSSGSSSSHECRLTSDTLVIWHYAIAGWIMYSYAYEYERI